MYIIKSLNNLISNPKNLFLIDGIGAFLTALILSIIAFFFDGIMGMPKKPLYVLSIIAITFSVYSLCCYCLVKNKWKSFLKNIAIANLYYCFLTIVLAVYYCQRLTLIGFIYFLIELFIILTLARLEFKALNGIK